ncbi:DnaJ-domain-containing protein [Pilatotrama ljubarskyi]|nr:DnaJ-domain-containing protein [Pilatotrama ljubarskyi]
MPVATTEVDKHLETLGLTSEDLNEDAVRVAYKKLALRWHPDRHNADPEEAKQKFIEVNEAYKALVEVCKKRNKRSVFRRNSSFRGHFRGSSAPSASSSSTRASRGTESTAKEEANMRKQDEAYHAHPDNKPGRSENRGADAAPRTARAHSKSPHRHHRDTDSDASSEAGSAHAHAHDHFKAKPGPAKAKKPTLGEDDYEFIDLGTPLKPLRSPRSFSATTKDWIFPLHLSLEDLYFGAVHRYRITRTLNPAPIPPTKLSPVSSTDAGSRRQTVQIDVHVSPGWTTGTRIRVPRVGNQRPDGSIQDIVFVVAEAPHPRFVRRGDDLILPVRVPWIDPHPRPYPPGGLSTNTYNALGHGEGLGSGRYWLGRGAIRQMRSGLEPLHGQPPEEADEVYVLGINGEEYTIPIPRTLVEAADGTRIYGAGMPVRKNGCIVGMGDMVIRCVSPSPSPAALAKRSSCPSVRPCTGMGSGVGMPSERRC